MDIDENQVTPYKKMSPKILKTVSSHIHRTPVNTPLYNLKEECNIYNNRSSTDSPFRFLGNNSTPPSRLLNVKNPFDAVLADKLHLPVFSPSIFKMTTPSKSNEKFQWTIESISCLNPAPIEEFPSNQFDEPIDPEIESKAHANIEKFFNEKQIVPSPWNQAVKVILPTDDLKTPNECVQEKKTEKLESTSTCDCSTQTVLSLPVNLPKEVEDVLKPYLTYTQDQQTHKDNIENTSLCRKLFHHEFVSSSDTEEEYKALSPIPHSPCIELAKGIVPRTYDSPFIKTDNNKSPLVSPIKNISPNAQIHQSTPSPHQHNKVTNSPQATLEESPLSPISKNVPTTALDENMDTTTNDVGDLTRRLFKNKSVTRLDFSGNMSVDTVPDVERMSEQSFLQHSVLGISSISHEDYTNSTANWDIENFTISSNRESKYVNLSQIKCDGLIKSYVAVNTSDNSVSNTPIKTNGRKKSLVRNLSTKISNEQHSIDMEAFIQNKENIPPSTIRKSTLRRSFSSIEFGSKRTARSNRFYLNDKYSRFNWRQQRDRSSILSNNSNDDNIRDRSILNRDCSYSSTGNNVNDSLFIALSPLSQNTEDTGYSSNFIESQGSDSLPTNSFQK